MTERVCPRCKAGSLTAPFGANRSNKDGLCTYCRACVNAMGRERQAAKRQAPDRPCRHCLTVFLPPHHNAAFCSDACRTACQDARRKAMHDRWYAANWAERRAKNEAWKKANRDKCRAYRRKAYRADPTGEMAAQRDWVKRTAAIADGKNSPVLKRLGFVLVRSVAGEWRAVRPGLVLDRGERVMAQYEQAAGQWIVLAPALVTDRTKALAARLAAKEKRQAGRPKTQEARR